jgi:hypothetical protein
MFEASKTNLVDAPANVQSADVLATVPRFIVMTSGAKMPASCWGRYGNVAVVETDGLGTPKFIGERARHLVRIVSYWGPLNIGGARSAYGRALAEAKADAAALNACLGGGVAA